MLNTDKGEEGVIDLRKGLIDSDEPEFVIHRTHNANAMNSSETKAVESEPNDKVKVKFDKFVNLVAMRAYEEILEKHADKDVVISTDLLADLASAQEEPASGSKWPLIFVVGILLGVGVAWLIFRG